MNLLRKKMLLAPILAITLALLLGGSVSFLPQNASQSQPEPQPTSLGNPTVPPFPPPVTQSAASLNGNVVIALFAVTSVIVGVAVAILLFSEKTLNKEISS
jgi:hypothetical protein